jgi:hypothetical protein
MPDKKNNHMSKNVYKNLNNFINLKERNYTMNKILFSRLVRVAILGAIIASAVTFAFLPAGSAKAGNGNIAYGQTGSGLINDANPVDWWEFSGKAGDEITIRMHCKSGDLAPSLKLWLHNGEEWEVLSWSHSGKCAIDAVISKYKLPTTMTYVIGASRTDMNNGSNSGNYDLTLSLNSSVSGGSDSGISGTGSCAGDKDCDGMPDTTELWLVENFKPVLIYDEDEVEDCVNPMHQTATLYQVTPYSVGRYGPEGAIITIVILYPWDCGGLAVEPFTSHAGDTEALRLFVTNDMLNADLSTSWRVNTVLMKRHHDKWEAHEGNAFRYQRDAKTGFYTHPEIWVSWSKHAMFKSFDDCEDYGFVDFEFCGGGPTVTLYTPPSHNIGERTTNGKLFNRLSEAGSSILTKLFSEEYTWTDNKFCGNVVVNDRDDCGGGLGGKWWPSPKVEDRTRQEQLLREYTAP